MKLVKPAPKVIASSILELLPLLVFKMSVVSILSQLPVLLAFEAANLPSLHLGAFSGVRTSQELETVELQGDLASAEHTSFVL